MAGRFNLHDRCLTNGEIARFLKISERQASRLMLTMPTIKTGRAQRRVLRSDFEDWLLAHREVGSEEAAVIHASPRFRQGRRRIGPQSGQGPMGSVAEAAAKLRAKSQR